MDGKRSLSQSVTFYTTTDDRFFVGTVGMINSLRLVGHKQRVVVLDRGLTERQRDVLGSECELVVLPDVRAINPQLLKPFANLMHPKGTVVVLDTDLVVTRSLDPLLEAARNGRVCVCADPESERWFAEWEQLFELPCPPRNQTYVNSGFVAFSVEYWPDLLPRWWDSCQRLQSYPTVFHGAPDSPTAQADQDALNALLMSEWPQEALAIQLPEAQPSMEDLRWHVRLLDIDALSCSLHGRPVTLVHPTVKTKPFERQWWVDQGRSPYPALLRRLLVERDVPIKITRDHLPTWLQPGGIGAVVMRILYLANRSGRVRARLRKWQLLRWTYEFLLGRLAGRRR